MFGIIQADDDDHRAAPTTPGTSVAHANVNTTIAKPAIASHASSTVIIGRREALFRYCPLIIVAMSSSEPWLRGPVPDVNPFIAPLLYSFEHAREDLSKHTEGLTTEQIWGRPNGVASIGFHIRHIGGSVERLMTYVQGRQLTDEQMVALKAEQEPGASRDELLAKMDADLRNAEALARSLDPVEAASRGVQLEWLVVLTPDSLEEALSMAAMLLQDRTVDLLRHERRGGCVSSCSG